MTTLSPSDARLLITSVSLSLDCLTCKLSVYIVLEAVMLEHALQDPVAVMFFYNMDGEIICIPTVIQL